MIRTAFLRRIGNTGAVHMPNEILRSLDVKAGQTLKLYVEDDLVVCSKYLPEKEKQKKGYCLIRKVKPNREIVITKFFREKLHIKGGDAIEFFADKDKIIIKKFKDKEREAEK